MPPSKRDLAHEFLRDKGKGRLAHQIVCALIAAGLVLGLILAVIAGIRSESILAFLFPLVGITVGAISLYAWYYLGKSILMIRDRYSCAAEEMLQDRKR